MVPSMAILQGPEFVGKGVSLRDGTLSHSVDTVHLHSPKLTKAVPVYRSSVGMIIVLHVYHQLVSPAGLDERPGKLFVEDLAVRLLEAVCSELFKDECLIKGFSSKTYSTYSKVTINFKPNLPLYALRCGCKILVYIPPRQRSPPHSCSRTQHSQSVWISTCE